MVLDALTYAGNLENLAGLERDSPRYEFVRGDICDEAAVSALLEQHRIDTLVHFAAESHVDRSILGPDDFIRTNVVGTHALLKAAKAVVARPQARAGASLSPCVDRRGVRLLGSDGSRRFANRPRMRPIRRIRRARPPPIIWCAPTTRPMGSTPRSRNCSNNYGPYQFPEKLIPLTLINILLGKPPAGLRRRPAGTRLAACGRSLRGDHPRAHQGPLRRGLQHRRQQRNHQYPSGAHPVRAGGRASRPERGAPRGVSARSGIERAIRGRADHACPRPAGPRPPLRHRLLAKRGASSAMRPGATSRRALRETLQWYLSNRAWWEALLGRDYAAWMDRNYKRQ